MKHTVATGEVFTVCGRGGANRQHSSCVLGSGTQASEWQALEEVTDVEQN